MSTRRVTSVMTVVFAVLAAACGGTGGRSSARLTVDGRATVSSPGAAPHQVEGGRTLRAGDSVKVESGTAVLRLSGNRSLELRAGTELGLAAGTGAGDVRPSLAAGDLLMTAGTDTATVATGDGSVAVTGGAAKVSRGLAVVAGSYTAKHLVVESAGRSLDVPALRQVSVVASGVLPARPTALVYDSRDEWDRRFLADAIELGKQLVARSRGFTAQLGPTEGRTAGFFRQLIPALDREASFDVSMLGGNRSPGEALVGLSIAVQGTRGTFADRLRLVLAFHDDGAAWGLVALDQGVGQEPLLSKVNEAIGRQPAVSASEAAKPVAAPVPGKSTTATTVRPSTGATITTPRPTTPPPAAGPAAPAGPVNTGIPIIDDTVKALVDLLSGILGGLGKSGR